MRAILASALRSLADAVDGRRRRPRARGAVRLFGGASPPRFRGKRSVPPGEGGHEEFRRSRRPEPRTVYRDRPVYLGGGQESRAERHERMWRDRGLGAGA